MKNKHIIDQINNEINNNKLSHSYMIETNNSEEINDVLNEIITLMMRNKDKNYELSEFDPNIYHINSTNYVIKKEDVLNMMLEFNKKSLNDRPLIYVINGADKMNLHSSNTLLKFLEEPENNIIGIILTPNKELIIDTIVSRCRIYSLIKEEVTLSFDKIINYIELIDKNIYDEEYFEEEMQSKEKALEFFTLLENYFLNNISNENINKKLVDKVFEYKNKIKFNTNLKLMFKAFDIEFRRYYGT